MQVESVTSALRRGAAVSVFAIVFSTGAAQQMTSAAPQSKPLPMPQDRVADSYVINSQLLPGDEIEWGEGPAFVLADGGHDQGRAARQPLCDWRHDEPS
jgi:hypothetical protein